MEGRPCVMSGNAKQEIERRMSDVADLLGLFIDTKIDERAWRQLLTYAPAEVLAERYARAQAVQAAMANAKKP